MTGAPWSSLSHSQAFCHLLNVPQLSRTWCQNQAPEKGEQNSAPLPGPPWFCVIMVPRHKNKAGLGPLLWRCLQTHQERDPKASTSYS